MAFLTLRLLATCPLGKKVGQGGPHGLFCRIVTLAQVNDSGIIQLTETGVDLLAVKVTSAFVLPLIL